MKFSPSLASFWVDFIPRHILEEGIHVKVHFLGVREKILALLLEHSRHSKKETALQAQCNRGTRLNDLLNSFLYLDILDCLTCNTSRLRA